MAIGRDIGRLATFSQASPLLLWLSLAGCGAPAADPLAGTEALLQVGVDARREADALEARLGRDGLRLRQRLDGRTFSALSLGRPETGETLVRVVTRAGIALAVDAPAGTGGRPVGLVDLGGDVDGDGHEELGVFADDLARDRRCVAIVRVDERGGVREVRLDAAEWGGDVCVEGFEDVDGDGGLEALVVARYPELSTGTPPRVSVPYRARGWRPLGGEAMHEFARAERRRRQAMLHQARERSDLRAAVRLGVELAALARLAGASVDAQIEALRDALRGLRLPPALTTVVEDAEALIRRAWREDDGVGSVP